MDAITQLTATPAVLPSRAMASNAGLLAYGGALRIKPGPHPAATDRGGAR
jgi:hypothetical protein